MQKIKKCLKMLHTPKSFVKYAGKQTSTWIGLIIFIIVFRKDLFELVHNVLTSSMLSERIVTGLCGTILILFNKVNSDSK